MSAVQTYKSHNMWHNRMEGEEETLSSHVLRSQAIAEGRTWAKSRQADHVVKRMDGSVEYVTPFSEL